MTLKTELDHSLLARFYRKREFDALEEFIRRHRNWAVRRASQFSSADAEDIVQVSILRLIAGETVQDDIISPLGWWNKIIVGAGVDHLRSSERRKSRETAATDRFDPNPETQEGPEDDIARKQLLEAVESEMNGLGDKLRSPLVLRFLKNHSYAEISRLLGIPTGTVSSRIHRGLSTLKSTLLNRGHLSPVLAKPIQSATKEKPTVKRTRQEIIEQNQLFARKWDDLWTVSGRSLGKIDSSVDSNGDVSLKWRVDTPTRGSTCPQEFPDQAKDRSWSEEEVVLSDARLFCWTKLISKSGVLGSAKGKFGTTSDCSSFESTSEISTSDGVKLNIQSSLRDDYVLETPGEGPIVINPLLPLVLGEACHKNDESWPIRFLGSWQEDEKDLKSMTWVSIPAKAKYLGKTGQPLQQGHLYEFVNLEGEPGQQVSHWETEQNQISGTFWDAEGWIYTREERIARAMVAAIAQ